MRFLNIKPISYLIMVCYHQNPIRRTLGLTIFFLCKSSLEETISHTSSFFILFYFIFENHLFNRRFLISFISILKLCLGKTIFFLYIF